MAGVRAVAGWGCCRAVVIWVIGLRAGVRGCMVVRAARDAGHVWSTSPFNSLALGPVT